MDFATLSAKQHRVKYWKEKSLPQFANIPYGPLFSDLLLEYQQLLLRAWELEHADQALNQELERLECRLVQLEEESRLAAR